MIPAQENDRDDQPPKGEMKEMEGSRNVFPYPWGKDFESPAPWNHQGVTTRQEIKISLTKGPVPAANRK